MKGNITGAVIFAAGAIFGVTITTVGVVLPTAAKKIIEDGKPKGSK
jgi:hypothetical protein